MVIKGRSRGNGAQLADYLLNSKENERAHILEIRGTGRPDDLRKSLLEMSLTSELTKGVHGLYHAQINPAIGEDQPMTPEDWQKAADILEKHLGFDGQKRVIVIHEKNGRIHAHVAWERYDHNTGILLKDGKNYGKHDLARDEIEREFKHERTPQRDPEQPRQDKIKSDYKRELSDLWEKASDGKTFVREAEKAGYQIAKGDDRRPWRVITPDGKEVDLVRQLDNAKTKDVRERLQPIREELQTIKQALEKQRTRDKEPEKQPGNARDLSGSQTLANAMLNYKNQEAKPAKRVDQTYSYSISFNHLFEKFKEPTREPDKEKQSDNSRDLSDSQDLAEKMRQHQKEQKKYFHHITGHELTEEQWNDMQQDRGKGKERTRERTQGDDYDL